MVCMIHGLERMSKTAKQIKEEFQQNGKSFAEWAREKGYPLGSVRAVLYGHNKGYRGQAHKIAVELGMKDRAK